MLSKIKWPDWNHVLSMMFVAAALRCIIQLVKIGHIEIIPVIESALVIGFVAMVVWAFSEFFQELFGRIDDDEE
jgi:hypothetical protein